MRDECLICKKHYEHGGKCHGKDGTVPCLIFEEDPRGKWVVETAYLDLHIGEEIPKLRFKYNCYGMGKAPKEELEFYSLEPVEWIMKGNLGIKLKAKVGYWSNEGVTDEIKIDRKAKRLRSKFEIIKK